MPSRDAASVPPGEGHKSPQPSASRAGTGSAANDQRFEAIRRMLCKGSADDRVLSGSEYDDMPWGEALGLLWAIEQDLSAARESLAMLRSAWNKHMETCPQHVIFVCLTAVGVLTYLAYFGAWSHA